MCCWILMWKWKGWIEPVIRLNEQRRKDRSLPMKIRSYHNQGYFEYAGAAGGGSIVLVTLFALARLDICRKKTMGSTTTLPKYFGLPVQPWFVKAAVFHEMGWARRLLLRIWKKLIFAGAWNGQAIKSCAVRHRSFIISGGGTFLPKTTTGRYTWTSGTILSCLAKPSTVTKIWKMPAHLSWCCICAWKSLLSGYSSAFTAVLKAQFDLCGWAY